MSPVLDLAVRVSLSVYVYLQGSYCTVYTPVSGIYIRMCIPQMQWNSVFLLDDYTVLLPACLICAL